MIKSDFVETLLVGSDYLSTLAAMFCFEKKSSVGLLHNFNFYQDPSFLSQLSSLEFRSMQALGEKYKIKALEKLQDYCIVAPFTFHSGSKSIILGQNIGNNLRELSRKLPELFNIDEIAKFDMAVFESNHDKYLVEFTKKIAGLTNLGKFRESVFVDDNSHFEALLKLINTEAWKSEKYAPLLRSLVGVYENYTPKKLDNLYKHYHLLNIISPYYLVDSEKLNHTLLTEFESRGGFLFSDKIESFSVRGKKLEGVKLAELGKTFHFEEVYGIGQPREDLQLKVNFPKTSYQTVDFIFDSIVRFPETAGFFDYFTKESWLGSSIQSLTFQQFSDRAVASFAISPELKNKLEDSFIDYLQHELESIIRKFGFKGKYSVAPYFYNNYDWRFREFSSRGMKKSLSTNIDIKYTWWTDQKQNFANTHYIGMFSQNPMGKVSLLHKIQNLL